MELVAWHGLWNVNFSLVDSRKPPNLTYLSNFIFFLPLTLSVSISKVVLLKCSTKCYLTKIDGFISIMFIGCCKCGTPIFYWSLWCFCGCSSDWPSQLIHSPFQKSRHHLRCMFVNGVYFSASNFAALGFPSVYRFLIELMASHWLILFDIFHCELFINSILNY